MAGRIDRQMSRFALHCYGARPQEDLMPRSKNLLKIVELQWICLRFAFWPG
jgi:hypothetical protein